jgi:transposase
LEIAGARNHVIESSSLEVDRRSKQRKTDRLDVQKMVWALVRYYRGERAALRVIHVPPAEDEDVRNVQRGLQTIRNDKRRINNRIKGLLFAQGIVLGDIDSRFLERLDAFRTGDGKPLGEHLRKRLSMEFERLKLCVCQIRELEEQRAEWFRQANLEASKCSYRQQLADRLLELCGIGMETAWTLATELFSWRGFRNRRQLGAVVGLTPTPYSSGHLNREQGISKAGRGDVRRLLVEVAWLWLRYQPQSELTRWYLRKVAGQGTRIRRIAIVALARKLLIALWKHCVAGEVPRGARMKSPTQKRRVHKTASLGAMNSVEVSMA